MAQYQTGQIITTSLVGTELVAVDNGGAVNVAASVQTIANLGTSGGTTTTTLVGTELIPTQTAGGTQEKITAANLNIWAVASGAATTTLVGTEIVPVQTAGGVAEKITAANLNIWAVASGASTTTIVGTEVVPIQTAGGVAEKITTLVHAAVTPNATTYFTTSAQSNSTSVTLSAVFTALTFTQTSTGNTVNLKAAPVDGEIQGISMTNIITNLTVSSAANTVLNGAVGTTVAGQALWWRFSATGTSWYKYN